ncbi:MAG TPA: hypothetical protein PKA74_19240 [Bauldia sp.]|nr:hypothetical protein [Bauldia sp.]
MSILSRALLAATLAGALLAPPAAFAGGPGFAAPQLPPPPVPKIVYAAQLGIQGPKTTVCPAETKVAGCVFTSYPGPVQVMIARKGQGVGAPFTITAKKAADGRYMATYTRTIPIHAAIDAEYRLLVGGGSGVMSNWVPLKASCKVGMPGELGG